MTITAFSWKGIQRGFRTIREPRQMVVVALRPENWPPRPLWPALLASFAPSGHLLYETLETGNERFGRPKNPDFLTRDGELREVVGDAFEVLQ